MMRNRIAEAAVFACVAAIAAPATAEQITFMT